MRLGVLNYSVDRMYSILLLTCQIQGEETYDQDMKDFLYQNE